MLTVSSNGCGLLYQRIVETAADVTPIVPKNAAPIKRPSLKRRRIEDSDTDDEPGQFRRVRMRCRRGARKQNSQDLVSQLWQVLRTIPPGKPAARQEQKNATEDIMNSIREVALFALALTGINGSVAQFTRGTRPMIISDR